MATVRLSVGAGTSHDQNVNITNVTGTGPWTVTLAAAGTDVVNGDALWDEHATPRQYLITAGGGTTSLTVRDTEGVGGAPDFSGTSTAQVKRYYATITAAEADLDDTGIYAAADDAILDLYNDAAFDEAVTVNGGGTVGLNTLTFTVPAGERHDGTAGTGARIVRSAGGEAGVIDNTQSWGSGDDKVIYEWLEVDVNANNGTQSVFNNENATAGHVPVIQRCIFHGITGNAAVGVGVDASARDIRIQNCIVYEIRSTGANRNRRGINVDCDRASGGCLNNTVYAVVAHGSGTAYGITQQTDSANGRVRNNLVAGTSSTSGTANDFNWSATPLSNVTTSNNCSEDATADDGGGSGHLVSQTAANMFVSTTGGSEDLHCQDADAPQVDAGVDLVTTPTGVNVDIDGRDRDAEADTWDIGADEFFSSGATLTVEPGRVAVRAPAITVAASVSIALASALCGVTAPDLTVSAGASTQSVESARIALTAPDLTLSVGTTLTLEPATIALMAPDVAVSVGAVTLSVDPARIALTAPDAVISIAGALLLETARISLTAPDIRLLTQITAQTAQAVPGPRRAFLAKAAAGLTTLAVDTSRIALTAPDLIASAGASTQAVEASRIALTAPDVAVSAGAATQLLETARIALTAPDVGITIGAVLAVDTSRIVLTAPDVTVAVGASTQALETARVALTAPDITVFAVGGAQTLAVDPARIALTAPDVTTSTSAISVAVDTSRIALTAPDLALSVGTVVAVDAARVALTAPDVAVATTTTVALDAARIALTAPDVTVFAAGGIQTLAVEAARIALTAPDLAIAAGAITVAVDTSRIALTAPDASLAQGQLVDVARIALTAPDVTVTVGASTQTVESARIAFIAPDVTVSAGAITITVDVARWAVTTPPISLFFPGSLPSNIIVATIENRDSARTISNRDTTRTLSSDGPRRTVEFSG